MQNTNELVVADKGSGKSKPMALGHAAHCSFQYTTTCLSWGSLRLSWGVGRGVIPHSPWRNLVDESGGRVEVRKTLRAEAACLRLHRAH